MRHKLIIALCSVALLAGLDASAQADLQIFRKKKKTEAAKPAEPGDSVKMPVKVKKNKYDETIKGSEKHPGLFTAYMTKKGELLLEVSRENLGPLYLMANRMTETSDDMAFTAGEMVGRPFMFRLSADTSFVHMHAVQTDNRVRKGDAIETAFRRNNLEPVMKSFKVKANRGDSVMLIDVTEFFKSNEKVITPLKVSSDGKRKEFYDPTASKIESVKCFERNVEITSRINFQSEKNPYMVQMRRSILLLPEEPMPVRYQDNRVGYFSSRYYYYATDLDKVDRREFIHRWRLEPREEDMEKYFAGELVEPRRQIVFYVDPAFPEKWRPAVKAGIEDWNKAFEAAGFRNAVRAEDYPTPADSTAFDPDDIRYNCIRYVATDISNAMGPSFTDPRSGEILVADVMWYHNVVKLVHNWRFAQTGAVDPRVRKLTFDDEVMRESLRYVASHEIGHTLGLEHNMGASYAFPVDSLRSPTFTQKYGTTPSIMDYARNNFVAQPGDPEKGVRLTPPLMGVYDIHAINWGYRLFPGIEKPEDEYPYLNAIIAAKEGDPMYKFGAQQIFGIFSPADQTEDLGNDHFRSGDYAIANLKRMVPMLEQWFRQEDRNYQEITAMYSSLLQQYNRHFSHVLPYLGGVEFTDVTQNGKKESAKSYIARDKQKKAMGWLVDQALTVRGWLLPESVQRYTGINSNALDVFQYTVVGTLFDTATLGSIYEGERSGQKNIYTLSGYMKDAVDAVLVGTLRGRRLSIEDQNMQSLMVTGLLEMADLIPQTPEPKTSYNSLGSEFDLMGEARRFTARLHEEDMKFCGCTGLSESAADHTRPDSYARRNMIPARLSMAVGRPVIVKELRRIDAIYKQARAGADEATRAFYDYQILKIGKYLKP